MPARRLTGASSIASCPLRKSMAPCTRWRRPSQPRVPPSSRLVNARSMRKWKPVSKAPTRWRAKRWRATCLTPTRGQIFFNGREITGSRPASIARMGLVRSFQISAVFPKFTVLENVRIALQRKLGHSFDFWRSESTLTELDDRARSLIEAVGLSEFVDTAAGELAYGRKRALEIATTLALEPE